MSCLVGPYLDDAHPELIDHVATDFPDLNIVIQHAGWPYVREAIGLAYKQPNIYLVPSQYVHYGFPGPRTWSRRPTGSCRTRSCSAASTR